MSFLSNRPLHLIALIRKFEFRVWVHRAWDPAEPATPFTAWLQSMTKEWAHKLAMLRSMCTHNPGAFSLDLTIMAPALLTFRLRQGVCGVKPESLLERVEVVIEGVLTEISEAGRWPGVEYVHDATSEI